MILVRGLAESEKRGQARSSIAFYPQHTAVEADQRAATTRPRPSLTI